MYRGKGMNPSDTVRGSIDGYISPARRYNGRKRAESIGDTREHCNRYLPRMGTGRLGYKSMKVDSFALFPEGSTLVEF